VKISFHFLLFNVSAHLKSLSPIPVITSSFSSVCQLAHNASGNFHCLWFDLHAWTLCKYQRGGIALVPFSCRSLQDRSTTGRYSRAPGGEMKSFVSKRWCVDFEGFVEVKVHIVVFWVITTCCLTCTKIWKNISITKQTAWCHNP
jgi:hypothetical protein